MRISLNYGPSSYFGWGIEALNTMLYWPDEVLCTMPDQGAVMRAGDPRTDKFHVQMGKNESFIRSLHASQSVKLDCPVFIPLGNDLRRRPNLDGVFVTGSPTIAFPYIEDCAIAERNKSELSQYDLIVCASHFNQSLLQSWGFNPLLIHQGIDTTLFNPCTHTASSDGRFRVFSGGKAEYRKGQDLVLQAFSRFAQSHSDALLVAAWSSPWPGVSHSFRQCEVGPPPGANLGMPNFNAWAQSIGIPPSQFQLLPATPNCRMPDILSSIDVALFPNRIEGGTNQVAMECIASNIPTILSHETGHATLIAQTPSLCSTSLNIDELINHLELAYDHNIPAVELPDCFSWAHRVDRLSFIFSGGSNVPA